MRKPSRDLSLHPTAPQRLDIEDTPPHVCIKANIIDIDQSKFFILFIGKYYQTDPNVYSVMRDVFTALTAEGNCDVCMDITKSPHKACTDFNMLKSAQVL